MGELNHLFHIMKKQIYIILLGFGLISLSSCVSYRKHNIEIADKEKAKSEAAREMAARREAEQKSAAAQAENQALQAQLSDVEARYKALDERSRTDKASFDQLSDENKQLIEEAARQNEDLRNRLGEKENELNEKQRYLNSLQKDLEEQRQNMNQLMSDMQDKNSNIADLQKYKKELEKDLAAREKRVKELESAIAARDAKAKALREKLAEALLGFQSSDLTVEERNGRVYVSMSQNLLFASGSAQVGAKGISALSKLAEVLNKNEDISILVEGHTDSDGSDKNNWELSTRRSLAIVEQLTRNKVGPDRLTAAGRGQHLHE